MKVPKRLKPLVEDGLIDEILSQLMSGKEAQVYVVRCGTEMHQKDKDFAGGTWALVDEQAKREGESRSGLLARAALDYIERNSSA